MDISIIGKQLAKGRKEKGLSQSGLADLLAVTPQAVSKWENSTSLPDIFMLAKISDILDIYDLGYFLGKEPPEINIKGGNTMAKLVKTPPPCACQDCDCDNVNLSKCDCNDFTTVEQFVEYWESCSLKGLQKIAQKYDVDFNAQDTKESLVKKLTDGMKKYC